MSRPAYILDVEGLDALIGALCAEGYDTIGPRLVDGALAYGRIASVADLPRGWTEVQSPGRYRIERRSDEALFGFTVPGMSWKTFLHPPKLSISRAERTDNGLQFSDPDSGNAPYAFIGVRPCELAAIEVQDTVFLAGSHVDTHYQRRREPAFIVAVQCAVAAPTCFCPSMGTGPRADAGFDLALTELHNDGRSLFVVEVGSPRGAAMLRPLPHREADDGEFEAALEVSRATARSIARGIDTTDLPARLEAAFEHPRWDDVATRCLSCANCTMVCPTCFCSGVVDQSALDGQTAERVRQWESCFTAEFSYMHAGSVRRSTRSRYRQWLTHKLGTWVAQFGTSGCVGCGRCITWCPVGIDITEEVAVLRLEPTIADVPETEVTP
jgi:ferredoxin